MSDNHNGEEFGIHGERMCFEHDKSGHWKDDYAYANEPHAAESPNSYGSMVKTLFADKTDEEMDAKVYRFALAYVRADGTVELVGSPDQNSNALINLLSKAISLVSLQQDHASMMAHEAMGEALGAFLGTDPDDDNGDDPISLTDYTGMYLL